MNVNRHIFSLWLAGAALLAMAACGRGADTKSDSDTLKVAARHVAEAPVFHADHDIGMLVRSIVDAIRVGEPLDTAMYQGIVVLTDGTGRPLYLDVEGNPGLWTIKVTSATAAEIANNSDGDLSSGDLKEYILMCLDADATTPDAQTRDRQGALRSQYRLAGNSEVTFTERQSDHGSHIHIVVRKPL